ncbi:MAG: gluconate:H+ symporter [Chitinophagaceae bacterium]
MVLLVVLFAIALQVFLTAKKISPFLSLLIVAIIAGLLLKMPPAELLGSIEKGVGGTLGGLVLIICLGAILGKLLEASGAASQITSSLVNAFGVKHIQWAVLLTGFLVGIPLYYNAGFIILVPLVFSIAKRTSLPLLYLAIPMAASLSVTHCFLPPHPGPVLLVNAFRADMGLTLIYGLIIGIPALVLAGPGLGRLMRKIEPASAKFFSEEKTTFDQLPGATASFCIALLPVFLISLAVIAGNFLDESNLIRQVLTFIGDSTIALLITVLLAVFYFGRTSGKPVSELMNWAGKAVGDIAMILLIITSGGVFKQVLIDSGTADYIASLSSEWAMPPLVFGWLVTALMRLMIGSATVSAITAAGIVTPLVLAGKVSPELMALAVGAGSVFGSHINDTGFWMFKEFFGLSLKQTFKSWSVMEMIISLLGLIGVLLLDLFV